MSQIAHCFVVDSCLRLLIAFLFRKCGKILVFLAMDALSSTSQDEPLRDSHTPVEATPNPIDAVMKKLADLRKVNQKVNERLDRVLHLRAKKSFSTKENAHPWTLIVP